MCRWAECPWCPGSTFKDHPEYDGDAREGDLVVVNFPGMRPYLAVVTQTGPYWPGRGATISAESVPWSFTVKKGGGLYTSGILEVIKDKEHRGS